ncbi:hypothetical protein C2G38_2051159 [Gigaspora rosea]|uniref:CCHC-type domain-containing protein n=1 Tax=Gigaspora rosea TaxID=44941 RepID=A0A397TXE7_9GLOM|nr:hypothetical protein C2G38_2051159 [Gigaspora rosea]
MAQQSKKTPPPIPSKNIEQLRYSYESDNPFDGPPVPHKPDKLRLARIDKLESIMGKVADTVDSVADSVGQLTNQLGRMTLYDQSRKPFYCSNCGQEGHKKNNCPTSDDDSDDNNGSYDEENNRWTGYYLPEKKKQVLTESSQPKTYDELLPKLSPAMRKMCLSQRTQEKKSNEWFSSLQYLNTKIDDLTISNSFLDGGSEFGGVNDATIGALGWKADKPSDFAIKGNSKHITKSLG